MRLTIAASGKLEKNATRGGKHPGRGDVVSQVFKGQAHPVPANLSYLLTLSKYSFDYQIDQSENIALFRRAERMSHFETGLLAFDET